MTATVWLLALSWRTMRSCTTKGRRFLLSSCDCDPFAKVKEWLRGTRYNTRNELIRAIGRSTRNINKDGRTDGVRRLLNICQKVINKGRLYWRYINVVLLWIKPRQIIIECCNYFLSNSYMKWTVFVETRSFSRSLPAPISYYSPLLLPLTVTCKTILCAEWKRRHDDICRVFRKSYYKLLGFVERTE